MIDLNLLTPENGFVPGCVVEVITEGWPSPRPVIFRLVQLKDLSGIGNLSSSEDWVIPDAHAYVYIKLLTSIRPLTGPMAIWNFAPGGVEVLHRTFNGNFEWLRGTSAGWRMNFEDRVFMDRPFWAKEKTE